MRIEAKGARLLLVLLAACGEAEKPVAEDLIVADVGLSTPECAVHDTKSDVYLVSNIVGHPLDEDHVGFISRIRPDGRVLDLKWIDSAREGVDLNAPKGMAIVDDVLYVADLNHVRKFDRRDGAPLGDVRIPGSVFLNDVAAGPDGSVFVTDTGLEEEGLRTDAVYRLDTQFTPRVVAKGEQLGRPNGILYGQRDLFLVTWGSGAFHLLSLGGEVQSTLHLPQGQLDGLVRTRDGTWLTSSWEGRCVYEIDPKGEARIRFSGLDAPADLGYDEKRDRLLIPLFNENRLIIKQL